MIKKNILGLLFLLSALCLFNSCEDDPYYDDYGWATDALCNNTWVDFYTNNKGYECEHANGTDYYEDVRIGNEYLKCFLNGDRVTFEAFHW